MISFTWKSFERVTTVPKYYYSLSRMVCYLRNSIKNSIKSIFKIILPDSVDDWLESVPLGSHSGRSFVEWHCAGEGHLALLPKWSQQIGEISEIPFIRSMSTFVLLFQIFNALRQPLCAFLLKQWKSGRNLSTPKNFEKLNSFLEGMFVIIFTFRLYSDRVRHDFHGDLPAFPARVLVQGG